MYNVPMYQYFLVQTKATHQVCFLLCKRGVNIFILVADISLNLVNAEITCIDISPLISPLQKHLEYCN